MKPLFLCFFSILARFPTAVKGGVTEDFIGVKIYSATQFRRTMLSFDVLGRDLRRRRRRKW